MGQPHVFREWSRVNPVAYSPSGKSQSEGNGELRLVWELREDGLDVQKNPLGQTAYPDIVYVDGTPCGEVKEVSSDRAEISMGSKPWFSDPIRSFLWRELPEDQKPSEEVARDVLSDYLGKKTLAERMGEDRWREQQERFLLEYFRLAGGRIFLVSEDGYVEVQDPGYLEVVGIRGREIRASVDKNVRPFRPQPAGPLT